MTLGINGRFLCARVTGVQRFAREVAARLLDAADAVVFVPRGAPVPDAWREKAAIVEGRLGGHAWEQLELPRRAARCDVLLHLAGTAPLRGPRSVLVVHDLLPLIEPSWFAPRFAAWHRFLLPRIARRSARIVTVSQQVRTEIAGTFGIPASRIVVAPQGVAPFDRPADDAALRRARAVFGLPERFILALGAGDPRKNVPYLMGVMEAWREREPDAPALVVAGAALRRVHGDPRKARVPVAPFTARDGSRPERADPTLWLGRVADDELRALYTLASAFAFPSFGEGFGRPPLEALACGTPAVVADYPAAREVVGDEAAIVPFDMGAWIEALRTAVAHRDPARDRMRAARVAARWRWEDAARAVLDACRAACDSTAESMAD